MWYVTAASDAPARLADFILAAHTAAAAHPATTIGLETKVTHVRVASDPSTPLVRELHKERLWRQFCSQKSPGADCVAEDVPFREVSL